MDPVVVSAVLGSLGTIMVALVGAFFGRKWNLPGLGREIQAQQSMLIKSLQDQLVDLRQQLADTEEEVKDLSACRSELRAVTQRLRWAEADLLELYRAKGQRRPSRPPSREPPPPPEEGES